MTITSKLASLADSSCSIDIHDVFGPTVAYACLNGFDFTLLFEESILTLLPLLLTGKRNDGLFSRCLRLAKSNF